jgi:hypothetical protein
MMCAHSIEGALRPVLNALCGTLPAVLAAGGGQAP